LRANTLLARGRALLARGRFAESLPSFEAALAIARELADLRLEARALLGIGVSHHRRHRAADARPVLERALELFADDLRRVSVIHGYLGAIEQQAGYLAAARTHYREAL